MEQITKVILLIESSRAFGRRLLEGIGHYCRLHGPWSIYRQPQGLEKLMPKIKDLDADGIITRDCVDLEKILNLGLPTIVCQHTETRIKSVPNIITDSDAIGKIAAEHLLERGFKNFGYCGHSDIEWSLRRQKSFHNRIKKAGFNVSLCQTQSKSLRSSRKKINEWLKSLPKPVAIMACNDDQSSEILIACKTSNILVPDEVAIIGVDNDQLTCDLSNPQLSSISLNIQKAGYQAAKLLDSMIKSQRRISKNIIVEPDQVITRHSTDILAIEDKQVSQALKFIIKNSKKPLQVNQVVESTTISRRCLEQRFRQYLNRSIGQQIRQARAEQVARLLTQTNFSISKIAELLGFPGINNVARSFKKEKNITPLNYRKKYSQIQP